MNQKVKTQWLKALRSGGYVQGKNRLMTDDGKYCCLGVLCDLYAISPEGKKNEAHFTDDADFTDGQESDHGYPTTRVLEWAGLTDKNPAVAGLKLSDWNDQRRVGFRGIANRIEKFL